MTEIETEIWVCARCGEPVAAKHYTNRKGHSRVSYKCLKCHDTVYEEESVASQESNAAVTA